MAAEGGAGADQPVMGRLAGRESEVCTPTTFSQHLPNPAATGGSGRQQPAHHIARLDAALAGGADVCLRTYVLRRWARRAANEITTASWCNGGFMHAVCVDGSSDDSGGGE